MLQHGKKSLTGSRAANGPQCINGGDPVRGRDTFHFRANPPDDLFCFLVALSRFPPSLLKGVAGAVSSAGCGGENQDRQGEGFPVHRAGSIIGRFSFFDNLNLTGDISFSGEDRAGPPSGGPAESIAETADCPYE